MTTAIVDTGGMSEAELEAVRARAEVLGATEHVVIDGRARLYDEFISYLLKANYLRAGVYPSCVGVERISRPRRSRSWLSPAARARSHTARPAPATTTCVSTR